MSLKLSPKTGSCKRNVGICEKRPSCFETRAAISCALIDLVIEIFLSDLGERAVRHALVERFLEHRFERGVLLAQADADAVAEIGRIMRRIGDDGATLALLAGLQKIDHSVLIADDEVEPAFGEIEDGFLQRRIGPYVRLLVDVVQIVLMSAA